MFYICYLFSKEIGNFVTGGWNNWNVGSFYLCYFKFDHIVAKVLLEYTGLRFEILCQDYPSFNSWVRRWVESSAPHRRLCLSQPGAGGEQEPGRCSGAPEQAVGGVWRLYREYWSRSHHDHLAFVPIRDAVEPFASCLSDLFLHRL